MLQAVPYSGRKPRVRIVACTVLCSGRSGACSAYARTAERLCVHNSVAAGPGVHALAVCGAFCDLTADQHRVDLTADQHRVAALSAV